MDLTLKSRVLGPLLLASIGGTLFWAGTIHSRSLSTPAPESSLQETASVPSSAHPIVISIPPPPLPTLPDPTPIEPVLPR